MELYTGPSESSNTGLSESCNAGPSSLQIFVVTRQNQGNYKLPRQKGSIFQCSAFFMFQLSRQHMTTGKTIALTSWTFVRKVMPLLINMLPRIVTVFLPRSKRLLISWL